MPGHIESMLDECECSSEIGSVLRRASKAEAGWLARFTRDRVEKERETLELELVRELQVRCRDNSVERQARHRPHSYSSADVSTTPVLYSFPTSLAHFVYTR